MRYELIPFHKSTIPALEKDGVVHVIMKPVAESLGVDWEAQRKRIYRHPVLAKGASVMEVPSSRGNQETVVLDLERFHGWLVTISSERIADPDKRAVIVRYQEEAFRVVYEHFHGPMKGQSLQPPAREMIALNKEASRLVHQLMRDDNPLTRKITHELLTRTMARLGSEAPSLLSFDRQKTSRTERDVDDLFAALRTLDHKGVKWNASATPDRFWAIHPPTVEKLLRRHGFAIHLDRPYLMALKSSLKPLFLRAAPVKATWGRAVHCYIFVAETVQ